MSASAAMVRPMARQVLGLGGQGPGAVLADGADDGKHLRGRRLAGVGLDHGNDGKSGVAGGVVEHAVLGDDLVLAV